MPPSINSDHTLAEWEPTPQALSVIGSKHHCVVGPYAKLSEVSYQRDGGRYELRIRGLDAVF